MKVAKSVLLALSLSVVCSAQQANAQNPGNILRDFAGSAGGWTQVDNRRASIETQIAAGLTANKLTATQAADFRAQLKAIADAQVQAKSSGKFMGFVQAVSFNNQLDALAAQIDQAQLHTIASLPDVDALQAGLKHTIDNGVTAGKLSTQEAAQLRSDLAHVDSIENAFKAETGGNLTPRQMELLIGELNKVKASVDQSIRLGESAIPALNSRRAALLQKISSLLAAGKLTAQEATQLQGQLTANSNQQASYLSASGQLNGQQVLALASSLDSINLQIDAKGSIAVTPPVGASTQEIHRLMDRIANRIKRASANGRLSAADAADALTSLDQVAHLEEAYSAAASEAGGITSSQVSTLITSLDNLAARLDRQIAAVTPPAPLGGAPGRGRPRRGQGRADDSINVQVSEGRPTYQPGSINLPRIQDKTYRDIEGYWGQPYISELASREVIGGFPDGSFKPNDQITRAQFAAIAAKALKLPTDDASSNNFTDIRTGYWAAPAIAAASNAGLITGFPDGTFKPEDKITRAQALVILSKALKGGAANPSAVNDYTDAQAVPSWAAAAVAKAASAHIIVNFPNDVLIRPNALATRGEVAGMMYQTLNSLGADLPTIKIGVHGSGNVY